jgi:hypothetical protein
MDKSLLELYTDYLISSFGQTTATGLSQLLDGQISHIRMRTISSAGIGITPKTALSKGAIS